MSQAVTIGAMCDIEVHANMAVVLQHILRCLASSPTAGKFGVFSDYSWRLSQWCAVALPKICKVVPDRCNV